MHLPVDVFSNLVVTHESETFTIQGDGNVISLAFPNPGIAISALRSFKASPLYSNNFLSLLKILDVKLDVLILERLVLKLGPGITPNAISCLLGISEGRIFLKNLLFCIIPLFQKKILRSA